MADKLSESTWSGFLKKQKLELDDKALVKALATFDRTDEAKPEPRLKALDEVIKQIPEQVKALVKRKNELGDKPFGAAKDQLYELLEVAERLHKEATQAVAESEAQAQAQAKRKDAASDDDEEEESPALLTVKMKPLLRELRKGEVSMPFLIAVAGKETVLLVSRRAISPARGKLLKSQMAQTSGLKFIRGECQFENNALTFVVQSPGAALAKRLRQALLNQTEMKWKVRVRGEDGVEEEDGEDEEQVRKPATAEQLTYTQRLLKVRERYQKALSEKHPDAVELKALMEQAGSKVREQQDYSGATADLAAMEELLNARAAQGTSTAPDGPGGVEAGVAFKARMTALVPKLKQAQTAGVPGAQDAKLKASQAAVRASKRDFAQADTLLDEAEALIEGRVTSKEGRGSTTAEAAADVETEVAEAAEPVAAGRAGGETVRKGLVKYRVALLGFRDSLGAVQRRIDQLVDAVPKAMPDEADMALALKEAITDIADELLEVVDDAIAVSEDPVSPVTKKLESMLREAMHTALNHPLVRQVDSNPFGVDVRAGETLKKALGQVLDNLPATA